MIRVGESSKFIFQIKKNIDRTSLKNNDSEKYLLKDKKPKLNFNLNNKKKQITRIN